MAIRCEEAAAAVRARTEARGRQRAETAGQILREEERPHKRRGGRQSGLDFFATPLQPR
jgi:hypothetical protein